MRRNWREVSRTLAGLLLGTSALCASLSAHASVHADVDALVDEAVARGASPLALAPVLDLLDVTSWMNAQDALDATRRMAQRVHEGEADVLAEYLYLRELWDQGEADAARTLERSMGFVEGWSLVGPFANDGMGGFETAYGPEQEGYTGPQQRFEGRLEPVSWIATTRATESGYYDLAETIQPIQSSVAYGVVECRFTGGETWLEAAVDGAYRVWVNGVPAVENRSHLGGMALRDRAKVSVRRGWNTVLVKTASEDHGMGWHVRFVNAQGVSVASECRTPRTAPAVRAGSFVAPQTIADRLEVVSRGFGSEEYADAAMIVRILQGSDALEPWMRFADRAHPDELSSRGLRRLASVHRDHWRRVELLRRGATSAPREAAPAQSPWAMLAFIDGRGEELGWSSTEEVGPLIQALYSQYPDDVRVGATHARLAMSIGLGYLSVQAYSALLDRFGASPALCMSAMASFRSASDVARVLRYSERCDERTPANMATIRSRVARARQFGEAERGDALVEEYQASFAHRSEWHRMLGDLAAGWSDFDAAKMHYTKAAALSPGSAVIAMAQAQAMVRAEKASEAIAYLDRVLVLQPQNRTARELRQTLEADQERFYAPWRTSAEKLRALQAAQSREGFDAGALVNTRAVKVHPNGLSTTYIQRAWAVETRLGADDLRGFTVGFSPDSEIVDILSVQILRPDGTVRETFSSREVNPYSGPSSIYYDVRYRQLSFPQLEAGDILSVEYTISEVAYRNTFDDYFGDMWFFQSDTPLAEARYVIEMPKGRTLYHRASLEGVTFEERREGDHTEYIFSMDAVPAVPREASMPGAAERFGNVHVSTYRDWDVLARWYWNLIREQLVSSPEIRAKVEELTRTASSDREKVERIYQYVVRTVRYVGLEFGVHGFKPYRTTQCFSRRFGDCKDTASLIKVMLNDAGIDAHLVLIRTRDIGRLAVFPPSLAVFNHAIVYVPSLDLYLDGTTPHNGVDELVSGDQGASALIIRDGEGGSFVTTPYLPASMNVTRTSVRFDARSEEGVFEVYYKGQTAAAMRGSFETQERREDAINRWMANMVAGTELQTLEFSDVSDNERPVEFRAGFRGGRWIQRRGQEIFVLPLGREVLRLSDLATGARREMLADLGVPETVQHRLEIVLPEGVTPVADYNGRSQVEDATFGAVTMTTQVDATRGVLVVEMELRREAKRVSPADWSRFREWARSVDRLVNEPFVFTMAEESRRD